MKGEELGQGFKNAPSSFNGLESKKRDTHLSIEIPQSYGKDKVVVLPVNPHLCFSYWEITEKLFKNKNDLKARLYDDNGNIVYEFGIDKRVGDYYINTDLADKKVQMVIGYDKSGKFVELLRSNVIMVPRDYMVYAESYEKGGIDKKEWLKIIEKSKYNLQFSASFLKQEELIKQVNKRMKNMSSSYMEVYNV